MYDQQKLLMASTYDGDGNRAFQLNYNPEATCGYGIGWGDDIYMLERSQDEDESLTAEDQLFNYLCLNTGRAYDLTEYVNDTNRWYTQTLTAYMINSEATEFYSYAGNMRNSRNNIWSENRSEDFNETNYYLYDGRGSVTANTWYNGMVTDTYQYDPYDQVTYGSTDHTDFYGCNAESYNPNTGLEYLRARYYNANKGRFFQEDTYLGNITDPLTLNRYAYVKSSPFNSADPSGHWSAPTESTIVHGGNHDPIANDSNWNSSGSSTNPFVEHAGAWTGEIVGGLLAGAVVMAGSAALPIAILAVSTGAALGMLAGGAAQKDYQTRARQHDIEQLQELIIQHQMALAKISQGKLLTPTEYNSLQRSLRDLEDQLEISHCDIERYQNDITGYQKVATVTVVVVGGVSLTVNELMAMNAAQVANLAGIAQGDRNVFLKLFENLKNTIKANPDMLYKDYWG